MPSDSKDTTGSPEESGRLALEHLLRELMAKSPGHSPDGRPVPLTAHSRDTRDAVLDVAERIGLAGVLAGYPRFWAWAERAGLLHDAGKIAAGFQRQLASKKDPWGERHEVLSLAFVDLLTADLPGQDRAMIAAGVVFHHRPFERLREWYPPEPDEWKRKFGTQVPGAQRDVLTAWFAAMLGIEAPPGGRDRKLWERARDQFADVEARWSEVVPETDGLIAVLLQGAVTLADHAASAAVKLDTAGPLRSGYLEAMAAPYPHQRAAGEAAGHLVLISPTGSGKTEAGLAWASRQLESMPGLPRLVWVLPYRASINAMRDRFAEDLGCGADGIGVLHATVAATLLARITCDDRAPGKADADKARAMAGAMRLFRQRVRVATPHQLLRAAIAGPKYSSVLLEQANSVFVLDELHAYDPVTFGRICAAMRLWEKLGSRVAVVSATLAPPMTGLIRDSLSGPVKVVEAAPGTAPVRHRLVVDEQPLTAAASLDRIRAWLAEGRSVLVVANRVTVAQQVFGELVPDEDGDPAVLLHSRFRYRDRAVIEKLIMERHGQRRRGDPALRGGGLVVSTQALEVSLCLDFDRGVSEVAPVEAIAQRAGRVNRLGLHPDGPVEFRVHVPESHRPYEEGAIEAALLALREWNGELISEQAIGQWLRCAYETPWGRGWAEAARESRDGFADGFLTFPEPFNDRSEFAGRLDEQFDTVEVLLREDVEEYGELASGSDGDPLLAGGLLIPVRWDQKARLERANRARPDRGLGLWVIDAPYDARYGLDLADLDTQNVETIL